MFGDMVSYNRDFLLEIVKIKRKLLLLFKSLKDSERYHFLDFPNLK